MMMIVQVSKAIFLFVEKIDGENSSSITDKKGVQAGIKPKTSMEQGGSCTVVSNNRMIPKAVNILYTNIKKYNHHTLMFCVFILLILV